MFKDLSLKERALVFGTAAIVAVLMFQHELSHSLATKLMAPTDCSGIVTTQSHTVVVDAGEFVPDKLTVSVCDQLIFINHDSALHEPAVGPHPTHHSYPEFNTQRPLKSGETFSFQLTRTGTYSFHDHLHETMVGKITIQEK